MTALYNLQREFLAGLHQSAIENPFLGNIQIHPRVTPGTQFGIYRHSVVNKLQKALQAIYPVCVNLVGHDFFMQMAACYIAETPSLTPDLNAYGESLPAFIQQFPPTATLPYLADVARLEWTWHRLYGAPDSTPFDFQKLAAQYAVAGEDIILLLPPRTTLLTSPYPVHQIWEVNQADYTDDTTIQLAPDQSFHLCIWQQQHVFHIDPITPIEWQMLSWFQQALSLGQICEYASTLFPDINMAELLPEFVTKGWIADVS